MPHPKLTNLEMRVLDALWEKGVSSVREIQEAFPRSGRPAYTTVQTTVYRLERKKFVRCVKRISNANMFEAAISRADAQGRLIDELMAMLGEGGGTALKEYLVDLETKRTQSADFADYAERENEAKPRITQITRMPTKRSQAGG